MLTSPSQPGLSFARACMTSQCITRWGLSSNGITSLCPTSWHTPSTQRDLPKGWVCPPTYRCTSTITFILNVLGEVLGIGNLNCQLFYSAGSGPCARPKEFEKRLLNDILAKLWTFSSASDLGTDSYSTSG